MACRSSGKRDKRWDRCTAPPPFPLAAGAASHYANAMKALNRRSYIERSRRNLPHWRQEGVTYFITGRTADALPAEKLHWLRDELRLWLRAHGLPANTRPANLPPALFPEYYRRFRMTLEKWLDQGFGECRLKDSRAAQIVGDAFGHFIGARYQLGAWVVMPNHYHILVTPLPGFTLGAILNSWMSFTAKEIKQLHGRSGQFWQHEPYDHIVRNGERLRRLEQYIAENPVKAKLREGEFLLGGLPLQRPAGQEAE